MKTRGVLRFSRQQTRPAMAEPNVDDDPLLKQFRITSTAAVQPAAATAVPEMAASTLLDVRRPLVFDRPWKPSRRWKPGGLLLPDGEKNPNGPTFAGARLVFPTALVSFDWPYLFRHGVCNDDVLEQVMMETKQSVNGLKEVAQIAAELATRAAEAMEQLSEIENAAAAAHKFDACLTLAKDHGFLCDLCYKAIGEHDQGTYRMLCNMNALEEAEDDRNDRAEPLQLQRPYEWYSRAVCWRFAHTRCFDRHWRYSVYDRDRPHRPKLFFCSKHRDKAKGIFDAIAQREARCQHETRQTAAAPASAASTNAAAAIDIDQYDDMQADAASLRRSKRSRNTTA
jgi:hypothetical protein